MIDLKCKVDFDKIKKEAKAFITKPAMDPSQLGIALKSMVEVYGNHIVQDVKFSSLLKAQGCSDMSIHQIVLMSKVTGFDQLISLDFRKEQVDLEIYIKNAVVETGFQRETILRLTNDLAYAFGFAYVYDTFSDQIDHSIKQAYTIPMSIYQSSLEKCKEIIQHHENGEIDFEILESLVAVDLPKAKYYLGICLLRGIQLAANEERAVSLLQSAAMEGDFEAAAELGDYYFSEAYHKTDWNKAYAYYTQYGTIAITDQRKYAITKLIDQKEVHHKIMLSCLLFHIIMICTSIIFVPAAGLFSAQRIIGVICSVIGLLLLYVMEKHYKLQPFELPISMVLLIFCIWFFYLAARIWL